MTSTQKNDQQSAAVAAVTVAGRVPINPGVRSRGICTLLIFCWAVFVTTGCSTTIVPPDNLQEPKSVYLIDYGRHSGLVLPHPGEPRLFENVDPPPYVEFAFGEWQWFALSREGPIDAIRALLVPSQGTLGVRAVEGSPREHHQPGWHYVEAIPITVERQAALDLSERLARTWHEQHEKMVFNEVNGLSFVPVEKRYSLFSNCNPVLAGWLMELECEIRGAALLSDWRLATQDQDAEANSR